MAPFLEVRAIGQRYPAEHGEPIVALDDVSLEVARGEFITVVGPSGCGKSTLLRIFAGLLPASEGVVRLDGEAITEPGASIGCVFQDAILLPWRSVIDNVTLPLEVQHRDAAAGRGRALELLDMVGGLARFHERYPDELSGGMRQRVAISRALIHDPALLLMDEPFGALDAMTRETMMIELQRIWELNAKTILLITHSIAEAVLLGDRVLVMSSGPGRVIADMKIDLPRPRTLDMISSADFGDYTGRIRALLSAKAGLD